MKKKLKPLFVILIMILVAIVVVILYDKFTGKPEEAVKGMLTGLKTNDINMVDTYVDYNELLNQDVKDSDENLDNTIVKNDLIDINNDNIKIILNKLSYEVMNTRINNNEAVVTVSITNIDLKNILEQYFGQYVKIAFANGFSNDEQLKQNNIDTDSINDTMDDYLKSLINKDDNEMTTSIVEIKVKKENGNWKVEPDEKLRKAILPGMDSIYEYLNNINELLNK